MWTNGHGGMFAFSLYGSSLFWLVEGDCRVTWRLPRLRYFLAISQYLKPCLSSANFKFNASRDRTVWVGAPK